jgi:hypothetical protein
MKLHSALLTAAILMLQSIHYSAAVLYVDLNSTNPTPPYADWSTAATNIQDAVDASSDGDQILVTNGIYATGGRVVYGSLTNRVVINKAVTVQSVNGSAVTTIQGNQPVGDNAIRCVYLTNNAVLIGFTLTNGATRNLGDIYQEKSGAGVCCASSNAILSQCVVITNKAASYGGGVYSGTLNNCTLAGNTTSYMGGGGAYSTLNNCTLITNSAGSGNGGGAYSSTLNECTLIGNSSSDGGGAISCVLNRCTLTNNLAGYGGGASNSKLIDCLVVGNHTFGEAGGGVNGDTYNATVLINCTVIGNTAGQSPAGVSGGCALSNCIVYYNTPGNGSGVSMSSCCTTPLPTIGGIGNITNAPLFVNVTNDFHLQSNSPCINSGNNASVNNQTDLDGNPRIVGGTVDIGAYEYQTPTSIISYAWLQQYGLPTDGSADFIDSDGDGMNNWQEWIAGTDPTNALSVLEMLSPTATNNPPGLVVTWQSVNTRTYYLQSSVNLGAQPAFSTIQSNIVGQVSTTSFTDASATNGGPYFYRVGVQ